MDLSTELAQRCLLVKQALAEEDPNREEFEDLSSRERVARGQAARYREIAHGRSREEAEKTPAETFTGRLYPIPHTLGEAAWRVPAMVGGGALGYQAVAKNELPDVESMRGLLRPGETVEKTKVPGPTELSEFGTRIRDRLRALKHGDPEGMARKIEEGLLAKTDVLPNLLKGNIGLHDPVVRQMRELTGNSALTRLVHDEARDALSVSPKGKKGGPPPDPRGRLRAMLSPGKATEIAGPDKVTRTLSSFGTLLEDKLKANGYDRSTASTAAQRVQDLFREKPELVKSVLGMRPEALLSTEGAELRKSLTAAAGSGGGRPITAVVREAMHDAAVAGKTGLGEGLSKWKRYGGAGLGVAGAALATGIPLGLNALWKRREGGEAAARAKARMQEELDKADEASKQREAILARM